MRPLRSCLALATLVALGFAALPADAQLRDGPLASPNQPYASYWFPNELLTWDPLTDPDAQFNRSGVALGTRFTDPATQVNANARDGEGTVAAISIMFPSTSNNPSQGSESFDVNAFGYWQYVDQLVFWGGSAGEGLILAPSADVIDAGHRNGVPVLGTVFFPPNVFGGQLQWVEDLVQTSGSTYPVADKLIEVADYYGFDGWFINQETTGGDSLLSLEMQAFMQYFQANKSPGMEIMWYDSMIDTGTISWQNQLNDRNEMFFEDGGRVSDTMFLNFGWGANTRLADSRAKAISLGRDPYEVYAGVDVQALGYDRNVQWAKVFPDTLHTTSLGFYGAEWPYSSRTDHADYIAKGNRFWVGENRDPSNTATADDWKGLAHYVPAFSAVNTVPFVTNFNTGQGNFYAVDGVVLKNNAWNNRSVQSVMPTWRWIAVSPGTPLYPEFDWTDAYCGGSCLRVSGALDASNPTTVSLYKAQLPVAADTKFSLAYKTGVAASPSAIEVALAFADAPATDVLFAVGNTTTADWNEATIDLSAHAGRTIAKIGLRFASASALPGYAARIGQLRVYDGVIDAVSPPPNATVDEFTAIDARNGSVRMSWDAAAGEIYHYRVARVNPDLSRTFLNATPNTALYIENVERLNAEERTILEVTTISPEFGVSGVDTASVYWGPNPPNDLPCTFANGPYCGIVGQAVQFSSAGTHDPDGTIVGRAWTFGDGGADTSTSPQHTYAAPGVYEVVLTATDDLGGTGPDTTFATIYATEAETLPDVAWYPLDEGTGTIAGDATVNGSDGAINGATWVNVSGGAYLGFDGVDDYVLVSDYPKPASTMSVTAWVYADSRPSLASIAKNWAGASGAFHLGLHETDGDLELRIAQSNENEVIIREGGATQFPVSEWVHVAGVTDGEFVRLYRNGVEVASAPYDGTLKTTRAALGIGVKPNGIGSAPNNNLPAYWDGDLDDVRLYGRALCRNEIEAMATGSIVTSIPEIGRPATFSLSAAAPNPFREQTRIDFALPREEQVAISVYDLSGRRVATIADGLYPAGVHAVAWNGRNGAARTVASGVYFYRLETPTYRESRRVLKLR